jgi:DNA-binding SARP family transcriptional activator
MAGLRLFLLGPFAAMLDGEPVTSFESDKVRALLAYLAMEAERPHGRHELAGLLWPDWPERSARASLRNALANLRQAIGDRQAQPPFLLISRTSIQFNSASDHWLDVHAFAELLEADGDAETEIQQLEAALVLYDAPFLEGSGFRDSAPFEHWSLVVREGLQRQLLRALGRLAQGYAGRGEHERACEMARQRVALDPLDEEAHRALMGLYARSGRRGDAVRQYRAAVRLLEAELGVAPSVETTAMYERIRAENRTARPVLASSPVDVHAQLPGFLSAENETATVERPAFVARERELDRLDGYLADALAGHGRVVFVTGDAGTGKTALVQEFARRAQTTHPELVVASGHCTAYAGVGDPYLPFRDVMDMLAGAVEATWTAGAITREHARRLWRFMPHTVQALVEAGPDLIDVFVPGTALVGRLTTALGGESRWLARLRELMARKRGGPVELEQSFLFEEYMLVLQSLAARQPLLITLDDLQWAGVASISLLFHLGRRLAGAGSRILILGAYRPDEVALDWKGGRDPLEKALGEFKRTFGDIWVDLAEVGEAEGRRFVDRLLDTQTNELDEAFRQALFRQTGGHPLFTIELLQAMQARGDLVQDEVHGWVAGSALDWRVLPARVEGAIEERIGRLGAQLREILTVASVEGESFTPEVMARVQGLGLRRLLGLLSQELGRRHRLVREREEVQAGGRPLSRYQFSHILVQRYLYDNLSAGERRLLHGEIAQALEALYEGHTDEIAAQLVHHFREAREREKAIAYARRAARRAETVYALDEAGQYLQTALDLHETGEQVGTQLALLEELADVHVRVEQQTQAILLYQAALDRWSSLDGADGMIAVRLQRKILQKVINMRWAVEFHEQFEEMSETGATLQDYLESYLISTEAEAPHLERARVLTVLANVGHGTRLASALDRAEGYAQAAVDLAEGLDAPEELADALQALADVHFERDEPAAHLAVSRRRLALSRDPRFGDLGKRTWILFSLALALIAVGEYREAIGYLVEAEGLVSQNPALGPPLWLLVYQALCWLRLDRWDELRTVDKKRQALEKRYSREQIAPIYCMELAIAAAGLALQGDLDQARILREQSYDMMVQADGAPSENWGRSHYY